LDQETVDVGSINSFKGRLDKIRKTRMGFLWILYGPQSPRHHGDQTPVRPHKVSHKVSQSRHHTHARLSIIGDKLISGLSPLAISPHDDVPDYYRLLLVVEYYYTQLNCASLRTTMRRSRRAIRYGRRATIRRMREWRIRIDDYYDSTLHSYSPFIHGDPNDRSDPDDPHHATNSHPVWSTTIR